jgi:DNA-binding transcriptional MerR regulator
MLKYKIGDVSKILGISPDLVRYYEKKGVVSPVKDESNDYRYYGTRDTNFLIDCLFYKNFGFSIEETAELVRSCSMEEITRRFRQSEEVLEETIRREQLLLRRSREYRASVDDIEAHLGRCSFRQRPECIYYINRRDQQYNTDPKLRGVTRQWLKYLPFSKRSFLVPREELTGPTPEGHFCWGFSLTREYADLLGASAQPPVVESLTAQRCVYTVFSSPDSAFSPRYLDYAVDFIRDQGLTLSGPAYGNLIISACEDGPLALTPGQAQLTGYFEAWLPVSGQ